MVFRARNAEGVLRQKKECLRRRQSDAFVLGFLPLPSASGEASASCEKKIPLSLLGANEGDFVERNEVIVRQTRSETISPSQRNVSL